MFTAKQTRLMNTLGIVSDTKRELFYEAYLESSSEDFKGSFTQYLECHVQAELFLAERNSAKALKDLA